MSGVCPPVGGCTGEEQQMVVLGVRDEQVAGGSRGGHLSLYHVPQQCRKEKLRYPAVNEGPRWPPHTGQFPTSPSFLHDADLPNHFAASAAATSSLLPSPSTLLNPSFDAIPYECGVPAVHLLYGNTPFSGAHGRQEQGVTSLTLSSAISPSSQNDQHNPSLSSVISAHGLYGQLPHPSQTAPRMTLVPAGPFTGYATILQGSRFLRPAQQLLGEVCGGGGAVTATLHCTGDETASLDLADDGMSDCRDIADGPICDGEHRGTMSRLISMLDEVCGRYKQYCRQVQEVITSFDAVAGLNAAAPYTPVALRTLLRHFKYLKSAIIDQLRFANKTAGKEGITKGITGDKIMDNSFDPQRVNCLTIANQQPIWRPQRGLPERAVMVLRAWLFEHFLHPYPSDMDKQLLAQQTGLSRNQVSNWFINARVRLWKPMVEEIHSMEQQHNHKIPEHDRGCHNNDRPGFPSTPRVSLKISDQPHKRLRDEHSQLHDHNIKEAPSSFSLTQDTFVHHCANLPMGVATSTASGGVSLALGLHQNEGACLDEPLSMNSVVHRLEEGGSTVAYFMGGIDGASDRHFGRDFDGHLLRQFVA